MSISLAITFTIPAYPIGKPVDGRMRYGMTPEQAHVYGWLVKNRPHDEPFGLQFREVALAMATTAGNVHMRVQALIERGWLMQPPEHWPAYMFVHPVMTFKAPRDAA